MRFSVIMPAHNAGRWIGEALESVAAQTVAADEVIVIADSCTDDTIERARGFVELPIKVIACECRNAAATRNLGIREARGAFVAMLDADDVWLPNHLASALALLADSDDVAYMSG
ncbi:MAG: glycosyltransferase family A protein, partial [Pseudomonadota bacterium]